MKVLNKILVFYILIFLTGEVCSQSVYWRQIFGGPFVDESFNCIELRDGNYMMAGYKEIQVPGQIYQIPKSYIVKFDRIGNILWEKLIGDSTSFNRSVSLAEDPGGNIYLPFNSDFAHLVKLSSEGELIWERNFSSSNIIAFSGLSFVENNKRIIIKGKNIINGFITTSISKLDSNGTLIWNKSYYDSLSAFGTFHTGNNSFLFSDNEYFLSGFAQPSGGVQNRIGFILKIDTSGNVIWNKKYLNCRGLFSIASNSSNTFIISGHSTSWWLYCQKIDTEGKVLWSRDYFGDSLVGTINGEKIVRANKNKFALGTSNGINYGRLVEIDSTGNVLNSEYYIYPENIGIYQNSINNTSDSGYIVSGGFQTFFSNSENRFYNKYLFNNGDKQIDFLVYKIDKDGNTVWISNNQNEMINLVKVNIYPNPYNLSFQINFTLNSKSNVKIYLYNLMGKLVKIIDDKIIPEGTYKKNVFTPDLSSGIYFLKVILNNKKLSKKIMLVK